MCNRVLLFFGKLLQWNLNVNCHVNRATFQSGLRFQASLSSLRVSCKHAVMFNNIFDELKVVKYFNKIEQQQHGTNFRNLVMWNTLRKLNVCKKSIIQVIQAGIYDGAFFVNILNGLLFSQYKLHHRFSTGLYMDLWKI